MKNEGFKPPIFGLEHLKMKVVGSHGKIYLIYLTQLNLDIMREQIWKDETVHVVLPFQWRGSHVLHG